MHFFPTFLCVLKNVPHPCPTSSQEQDQHTNDEKDDKNPSSHAVDLSIQYILPLSLLAPFLSVPSGSYLSLHKHLLLTVLHPVCKICLYVTPLFIYR